MHALFEIRIPQKFIRTRLTPLSSPRKRGSSIPETLAMESISRSVLDHPLSRVMTTENGIGAMRSPSHNSSYAGLTRVSIHLRTTRFPERMDGRVSPGHDEGREERPQCCSSDELPSKQFLLRPRQRESMAVGVEAGHARL